MQLARLVATLLLAVSATAASPPWQGLPVRTVTGSGIAGDPVNVAFEGSRAEILAAFAKIGWVQADSLSVGHDLKLAEAAVLRRPYPTAPVSRLYLFKRAQDFSVEHELGSTVSRRDHARLWDTGRVDRGTHLELWIGDAARDTGVEILYRRHLPVGTTHHIDANVDAERDLIVQEIRRAGLVKAMVQEPGSGRTSEGRNGNGDRFYTDGKVDLMVLAQ